MNEDLKPGDYGFRRKREIHFRNGHTNDSTGINWDKPRVPYEMEYNLDDDDKQVFHAVRDMPEYHESDEEIEGSAQEEEKTDTLIKGFSTDKFKMKVQLAEPKKVTIYLDEDILETLKVLKTEKRINSYSDCIKNALVQYLTT